jgi:hypothetical protein
MTKKEQKEDWRMYKIKNSQHYRNICAIDLAKHRIESFKKNYSMFQPKNIQPYFESELDKIYKEINKIEI